MKNRKITLIGMMFLISGIFLVPNVQASQFRTIELSSVENSPITLIPDVHYSTSDTGGSISFSNNTYYFQIVLKYDMLYYFYFGRSLQDIELEFATAAGFIIEPIKIPNDSQAQHVWLIRPPDNLNYRLNIRSNLSASFSWTGLGFFELPNEGFDKDSIPSKNFNINPVAYSRYTVGEEDDFQLVSSAYESIKYLKVNMNTAFATHVLSSIGTSMKSRNVSLSIGDWVFWDTEAALSISALRKVVKVEEPTGIDGFPLGIIAIAGIFGIMLMKSKMRRN